MENNTEKIIQYKCPACGAPLKYSPADAAVVCEHCGSTFAMSEIKNSDKEDSSGSFDWQQYKETISDEKLEGTLVYECKSCGASMETDNITMATVCPYCGNNVVLNQNATAGLKPNLILPFKITKDKIPSVLKDFCRKKKCLPSDFFNRNKIGEIHGVYVPFWLFSSELSGDMTFHGEKKRYYTSGQYDCIETSIYNIERSGSMNFNKLPVDASIKMNNEMMDSLEPFDYSALVEFDKKYLAGYLADRFDSRPDEELPRAHNRMIDKAEKLFESTINGFSNLKATGKSLKLVKPSVLYTMIPVYLFDCKYGDNVYHYAVNGQTGKIVGHLPYSIAKVCLWALLSFFIGFGSIFAIGTLFQLLR